MKKTIILLAMVSLIMVSGCAFDEWARIDGTQMNKEQFKNDYYGFKGCDWWSKYGEGSMWGTRLIPGVIDIPGIATLTADSVFTEGRQVREGRRLNQCMGIKGYVKKGSEHQSIKECTVRSHDICDQQVKNGSINQSAFKKCQESAYRLCLEQWTP